MTLTISIIIYIVLISWLGWTVNRPEPDIIKKKGIWIYNKDFDKDSIITIPGECLREIPFDEFERQIREEIYKHVAIPKEYFHINQ